MPTPKTKGLDIDLIMKNAKMAAEEFRTFNQSKTDQIVKEVYQAAFNHRIDLAKMAHEETGIGIWQDKVKKNVIASRFVYEDIKNIPTVGLIKEDIYISEIAQPIGPIFCITPITNPTSTAIFKILIALKTRNPLIIRPHGAARRCTIAAAKICYEAALKAGAPDNCIQWIKRSTPEETISMVSHKKIALILATGSVNLVRAAYKSGNPAIGVGPGNVPVYIGKSSNVEFAVDQILKSKTFDYGTVCASEQAIVVSTNNSQQVVEEFKRRKAYFLNQEEIEKVGKIAFNREQKTMAATVIGQSPQAIANLAGISIPEDTTLIIAQLKNDQIGIDHPLSLEILAPILAFYVVDSFKQGIEMCKKINRLGGLGHTVSIFSIYEEKIREFATIMNAGRILVNTPSSQGALGGTYNELQPSLTLSCGSGGKNITTDNISVQHLLNIQRIARRKESKCLIEGLEIHGLDQSVDADQFDVICNEKLNRF
ncbi:MAG: aldehyde dehydrogenase family protein [Bacteroidetes bacterium]|nr:aldehyde dehydrogenase family protein [Bacteroidota bacterium]